MRTTIALPESSPWPELDEAGTTLRRLVDKSEEAYKTERAAEGTVRAAVDSDRRDLAEAYRTGGKPPKGERVEQAERDLAEAVRQREALALAVQEQEAAIRALVVERRDEWEGELDRLTDEAAGNAQKALDELALAAGEVARVARLRAFLRNPDSKKAQTTWNPPLPLTRPDGTPYTLTEATEALRGALTPPARPVKPAQRVGGSLGLMLRGSADPDE